MRGRSAPPVERFEEKARVRMTCLSTPCWLWHGARDSYGSGLFWDGERTVVAHRWAFTHYRGEDIPAGHVVTQRCANRDCVNPDHLWSYLR